MQSKTVLLFVILMIGCLGQFSSDIYAPSLPGIAENLSTTLDHVQWSMAIFMFGLAISQLFYGPLSEGYGRRMPLYLGLSVMLIGSFVCLFAVSIEMLILGRLIQGLGAGAGGTLWRSIFRDSFAGDELAKYSSYLTIFIIFIIPAAPVLGGYLQETFDWRANFVFLLVYTCVNLVLVKFLLKETSKHYAKEKLKPTHILQTFKELLTSRVFMGYTFCAFLGYGAFFAWFATGPVLCIKLIGVSPSTFGWLAFLVGATTSALAGWTNGKCVMRMGSHNMLRIAWSLMFTAGLLMLILKLVFGLVLLAIVLPVALFSFGVGLVFPNIFSRAFNPFGHIAGYAAAVYGFMQMSGAAVLGALVSHLPETNQVPLSIVFMTCPLLALATYQFVIRDH